MAWNKNGKRDEGAYYPFNMGIQWLRDSADICFRITECRQNDALLDWYVLLWDLNDRMSFEMTEEETKEMTDSLKDVSPFLNVPQHQLQKMLEMNRPKIRNLLSIAYRKYLKFLNERERIFKKKRSKRSWEEGLEKDF